MNKAVRFKLFLMMVLELFIWGAWLPVIFGYLGPSGLNFTALQQSLILNAFAIGSFTAMFFSTQFVDRKFSSEKFMAVSHLIGGLSILALAWVKDFTPFFVLMLIHCLFYVPTLSIVNSIAFTHLKDAQKEFGLIRMGGTIGWIMAQWPIAMILSGAEGPAAQKAKASVFIVAGIASLVLAAFSLKLPHTPPKPAGAGAEKFAWLEAFKLLKVPFILVLFIVTFIDATVHQCYFIWTDTFLTSRVQISPSMSPIVMSIGQVAEIGTMAVLGYFLKRLGWKKTMVLGILGHAVRFAVFAFLPDSKAVIVLINVLHGICYAFFFATVYIFVDEYFPKDIRATAQGMFNFLIFGLGPFVGNFLWPQLGQTFTSGQTVDWYKLFLVPSGTAVVASVLLLALFNPPRKSEPVLQGAAPAAAH
jgi:nucleoside transporter